MLSRRRNPKFSKQEKESWRKIKWFSKYDQTFTHKIIVWSSQDRLISLRGKRVMLLSGIFAINDVVTQPVSGVQTVAGGNEDS